MTREEIGEILTCLRKKAGLTRDDVANLLEKSPKSIGHWETGHSMPDANTLFLLCKIYDADLNAAFGFPMQKNNAPSISEEAMRIAQDYDRLDFFGKKSTRTHIDSELFRTLQQAKEKSDMESAEEITAALILLPRSVQPASAGTGMFLGPEDFETVYVRDNPLIRRTSFGVPVSGDSMEPEYHDGDTLLVEAANDVRVGEIGVFTLDGQGYVKQRGEDELISLNSQYEPIPMNESIRCNGRVIGVLDPDWIVEK